MFDNVSYTIKRGNALYHAIALIFFIAISAIYTNAYFVGTEKNASENYATAGNSAWNDSIFSGSPTISGRSITDSNLFGGIIETIQNHQGGAITFFILLASLLGIYIFLNTLKISPLSAIIGSISFGIFSYGIAELQAGETAEMIAICMIPYVMTGIVLIFNGSKIIGTSTLLIAEALQVATCHYQIIYYTFLVVLAYVTYRLVTKQTAKNGKIAGLAITVAAFCIAIFTNSETIFQELEYQKYAEKPVPNYDISEPYLDDKGETFSILAANIKGGKSNGNLSSKSETYKLLDHFFGESNAKKIAAQSPMYFGKKFFSRGPSYIGALSIFLALFGCICSRNKTKWWVIAITVISILLSCGNIEYYISKNIPLFYNFSNFSNILILAALGISILAALGTEEIINPSSETNDKRKRISIYVSTGILAIVLLLFVVFPGIAGDCCFDNQNMSEADMSERLASYMPQDIEYAEATAAFKSDYINAIHSDRLTLVRRDAAKSLVFILLGAIIASFAISKKINSKIVAATLAILATADLSLTNISIRETTGKKGDTTTNAADSIISSDNGQFRVADIRYDAALNDNTTCQKYNSIAGNGYCQKRYATLCDSILNKELALARYNIFSWSERDGMSQDEIQEVFSSKYKTPILDMMNVKYIILSGQAKPLENKHASGNVWLVDSIRWADSEILEIARLQHIDTKKTTVVNEKYQIDFTDVEFTIDSTDFISLTSHKSDTLKYKYSCKGNRIAVFSEIFYPKGWKARIDGQEASFFRCNYVMRGMIVPHGEHEIEFIYEPKTATSGKIASTTCNLTLMSIIAILCILGLVKTIRRKNIKNAEA